MAKATPTYDREKVLVGQARMFVQKLLPTSVPALPADTVAMNGAWPSTGNNIWVPVGATEEGMVLRFSRDTEDITVEEQLTPVDVQPTGVDMAVETVLSEDTLKTWMLAMGGGTITTEAASSGVPGTSKLTIGSDLDRYALGFEAENEFGMPRRVMIPAVVSVGQIEAAYRRAANARRFATAFRAICAPEEVEIVNVEAEALP